MARKAYLSAISVAIIIVVAIVTSTGFGSVGIVQGQGNLTNGNVTMGNVTLTPEQRAAMCEPGDKHVNTTESRICGIPKTVNNMTTTTPAANTTTGTETEAPPTNLAPSSTPPLDE